jgi:hypothetical protein
MSLHAAVFAAACLFAADQRVDKLDEHAEAVAAIRAMGGTVVEGKTPGAPVTVTLTGSQSPRDGVAHLKRITNLCTVDL